MLAIRRVKPLYGHQQGAVVSYSGNARSVPRWWWCRQAPSRWGLRATRGVGTTTKVRSMICGRRTLPGGYPRFWFGNDEKNLCRYGNGGDQETSVSEAMTTDRMGRVGPAMTGSFIRRRPGISSRTVSVCTTCSAMLSNGRRNNYKGAPADGSVWMRPNCRDFVLRGSSWNNPPMYLRLAYRAGGGLSRTDGTRTLTP